MALLPHGARVRVQALGMRPGLKIRIDVGRDSSGEFFDIRCEEGVLLEILDV